MSKGSLALFEDTVPTADSDIVSYSIDRRRSAVHRTVVRRNGTEVRSSVPLIIDPSPGEDFASVFDRCWLRTPMWPAAGAPNADVIRIADLFSGCGAMSLGATEGLRSVGLKAHHALAVDINPQALSVLKHNFPEVLAISDSVTDHVNGAVGDGFTAEERALRDRVGPIDLLIGGPPCQGHSDLNNHTRREDPKNDLYFVMARFAELFKPRAIMIENVPGARHDKGRVVQRTEAALSAIGYHVDSGIVDASLLGVPQSRRRFILAASLHRRPSIESAIAANRVGTRTLEWAIGDLVDRQPDERNPTFDTSARHSARNQERMQYLIDRPDLFDLPNEERPDCHRFKDHSYKSVYGKMYWDRPTQTITTGFGSTGQGRYLHPFRARSITPHEAARIQFIPDHFVFNESRRRALQLMIGNAVPPKLAYSIVQELFR